MGPSPRHVLIVFLSLKLLNTLAASLIWGINTLFLLDAGLSNAAAFAANAFFTAGEVVFEVPTGVLADTAGRRLSYLLGAATLAVSTLLYLWAWRAHADLWAWALTSILLGLGFTFFSGATEAWLVDALHFAGFKGTLDSVFAKGQIVEGAAMLIGSVAGGFIAQVSNLGVPYLFRAGLLGITFFVAFRFMKDWGFTSKQGRDPIGEVKEVWKTSIDYGFRNRPVRWMMLTAPFTTGVGIYGFYAMQPYLLRLYGDEHAYMIAGLGAALMAGAQIVGGLLVPYIGKIFHRRTSVIFAALLLSVGMLAAIGWAQSLWFAIAAFVFWGLAWAAATPVRLAYLNGLIPSGQRATVLSFDNLMGSAGGVIIQPGLGRVADVGSYGVSYLVGAGLQALALPFLRLARREDSAADEIKG